VGFYNRRRDKYVRLQLCRRFFSLHLAYLLSPIAAHTQVSGRRLRKYSAISKCDGCRCLETTTFGSTIRRGRNHTQQEILYLGRLWLPSSKIRASRRYLVCRNFGTIPSPCSTPSGILRHGSKIGNYTTAICISSPTISMPENRHCRSWATRAPGPALRCMTSLEAHTNG
jgi:hypothetical protein